MINTSSSLFIVSSTILSLLFAQSARAQVSTFNLNDPGFFNPSGQTTDTLESFDNPGFSLTLTSSVGFVGADPNGATANLHSSNLSIIDVATFSGFIIGNNNSFGLLDSAGEINGFQRLDFEFDSPVELNNFLITDLDSSGNFTDAVAIEGFTSTPGTFGTGIDPILSVGSQVQLDTVGIAGSGEEIIFVSDNLNNGAGNVNTNNVDHQASATFAEPVTSVSLYIFNNRTSSNNGQHGVGFGTEAFEISVTEVPLEFSPSLGLLISGGGLLGLNLLKKSRRGNKESLKIDLEG